MYAITLVLLFMSAVFCFAIKVHMPMKLQGPSIEYLAVLKGKSRN